MLKTIPAFVAAACLASPAFAQARLPAPGFHHLQLNSVDPEAAIDFYVRNFPSTSRGAWGGQAVLKSPNNVMVLFNKVDAPPTIAPQSAIWHFGWHVTDLRAMRQKFRTVTNPDLLPLYTGDGPGKVDISADTWPGKGSVLGLTAAEIAAAKAADEKRGGGPNGFGYLRGPDNVIIEYQGSQPQERFNHVHMYQDQVFCAQVWYQTHLNAPQMPGRGGDKPLDETTCKTARGPDRTWPALEPEGMFRTPTAAVLFGDVALTWYSNQGETPLAPTRGQLYDHIGLSVGDLDAWIAKLRAENVKFLSDGPYKRGDTRAAMIEGPSREAIELVEAR